MAFKHIDHALVETPRPLAYKTWLYWGKKPPNIVRTYIEKYCPPGGVVFDPFVGSGISVLESAVSGRRGIGFDLNPVGLFLAEDLATPLDLRAFDATVSGLKGTLEFIDALYVVKQTCKNCKKPIEVPVTCFHWKGSRPIAIRLECPLCGTKGTYSPSRDDVAVARWFNSHDLAKEWNVWAPDLLLGYSPVKPFEKVGGEASPELKDYFTGRNWFALAVLRNEITAIKAPRLREALLALLATITHLASSMMMVRDTRPDSSSLARQAYWLPEIFMESNVAELVRRATLHFQGYRSGKEDANKRFEGVRIYGSVKELLNASDPGFRLVCDSVLDVKKGGSDQVPDSSVDYIFTDPPYGGAIQYMELFTLWASWLGGPGGPRMPMHFDDEITVNPKQGKDTQRYNLLMRAAFEQCYRALKAGRWMHVTFHHTDVATFTSIVESAQTAGFVLQLVNHQPSLRSSDKALAQPFGSATGNYYLRFHKPARTTGARALGSATPDVYQRIVKDSVIRILAKRGEPTSFTQIMNEIYVDLSKKGVMMSGQDSPASILRASSEFVLLESETERLWWFSDPSTIAALEAVPLRERVERAVLSVLRRKVKVTFDDVLQEVLINFPNSLTPETGRVMDFLKAYAVKSPIEKGVWSLKAQIEEEKARTEHSRMIAQLTELGQVLGYGVAIGKTERSHSWEGRHLSDLEAGNLFEVPSRTARASQIDCIWYDSDEEPVAAFEVENTTTITDGIVRMANLEGVKYRAIVLPQARKPLLDQKLREPMLNPPDGRTWTFMFYEVVDDLLRQARQDDLIDENVWDSFEVEAAMTESGQGLLFRTAEGSERAVERQDEDHIAE